MKSATHPSGHGSANGHGNGYLGRLAKLLAFHEDAAHSIKVTLDLLVGSGRMNGNGHGVAPILAQALALDAARTDQQATKKKRAAPGERTADRRARRRRTALFYAKFSRSVGRTAADVGAKVGAAFTTGQRWGYLVKKGDLWFRTDKRFDAAATKTPAGNRL